MAPTARQRFTLLYAGVFVASAVALLVLTIALSSVRVTRPAAGQDAPGAPTDPRVAQLQAQLGEVEAAQSSRLVTGALVALAVMLVASVFLGRVLAGRVLRPLRTITAATRRISAENLHERLAVPGPDDEVKELADTVDGLLERLEAAFAAQRRFVANASHELRTPLTTMRASIDVAAAKPDPPAAILALADRLRVELDRVDDLLEGVARTRPRPARRPRPAGRRAAGGGRGRGARRAADRIAERGLAVESDPAPAWARGSPVLLARMVENLVDNAVAHNHDGGWVRIGTAATTTAAGATARLVVESSGDVLDAGQVARLGRPFTRLVADRTGSDGGRGLGLSIVAAVVEAHGGLLDLGARRDGGLRVEVVLPAAREPEAG
jgi:signal transduction histidine kinase